MRYHKYQALGNDYLIVESEDCGSRPRVPLVRAICDRTSGIGSDGVLVPQPSLADGSFSLRIFNPDGSEAEKSGNGLRMFALWLHDQGRVGGESFRVRTPGGEVVCRVDSDSGLISVQLGLVSFQSTDIPTTGPLREVLDEPLRLLDRTIRICGASLGNPHCVVLSEKPTRALARELGAQIEHAPLFPRRTNVQFVEVIDRHHVRIEIWERGACYTLSSGTSSCAAAAACCRMGMCQTPITVSMPGGELIVELDPDYNASIEGPANKITEGEIPESLLSGGR